MEIRLYSKPNKQNPDLLDIKVTNEDTGMSVEFTSQFMDAEEALRMKLSAVLQKKYSLKYLKRSYNLRSDEEARQLIKQFRRDYKRIQEVLQYPVERFLEEMQ